MRFLAVSGCAAVCLAAGAAVGQDQYPSRIIRIVAPATGGGSDVVARMYAPGLAAALGQQVIIDNRGAIATEIVAKSPPDGYTLLANGSPMWLLPLMRSVPYDPVKDFAAVTLAVSSPSMLVVHPSLPVKSARDLIALAKAKPGQLYYAAGTLGAAPHLAGELFKFMAGVDIVRVPYKGSGPALIGVMTGEVGLMFPGAASAWQYAKQGKVRGLAIGSARRSELFPGVPTVAESGLPGFESVSPQAIVAPARTPAAIVNRLNYEIVRVLNNAEVKERLKNLGIEVVGSTPEELGVSIKSEMARVAKLVKAAGIREE
ncbi:MAG TPA: tripartite tricarboxylate transporter substrate binding protein [Burkholderiales bacterium]|nr:tripartite tricarboxylate transporter substrate binding protein [Burkholderiales bacterium]